MKSRMLMAGSICALLVCLCAAPPALAQGSFGAIAGTAPDASGAVLPGVTVTLSNPGTIGGNQVTVTDARGTYQFPRLVPGRYTVKGSSPDSARSPSRTFSSTPRRPRAPI